MKQILAAFGAVFVVCAGAQAQDAKLARVAVANHSDVPLAFGVQETPRRLRIYDHPDDRVFPLPKGAEATFLIPPGLYRLVLNDRPTLTEVLVELREPTSFEFLPPPPDRPGIFLRILTGRRPVYDGPLDALGVMPESEAETGVPARPVEEWREYRWRREEAQERQPPAFFSCSIHPWVTSTSSDPCPLCGQGMDREW